MCQHVGGRHPPRALADTVCLCLPSFSSPEGIFLIPGEPKELGGGCPAPLADGGGV